MSWYAIVPKVHEENYTTWYICAITLSQCVFCYIFSFDCNAEYLHKGLSPFILHSAVCLVFTTMNAHDEMMDYN